MRFHYVASESSGKINEGDIDLNTPSEVLGYLASKGLRPISVKAATRLSFLRRGIFSSSISVVDKVFLTKYLALMLKVGTDLFHAIDILIEDFDKPVLKAFLIEVRDNLEKGRPFHMPFANYPRFFSSVFVSLIKAGEVSGNLEKIFGDLSVSLEKEAALKNRVRSALVYPVLLVGMAMLVVLFMITFTLPRMAKVFEDSGFTPPLFSRVVFAVGGILNSYLYLWIVLFVVGGVGGWYVLRRTAFGRRLGTQLVYRIPVIKDVLSRIAIQRFAATLSTLLTSGIPILDAIEITADSIGSERLRGALLHISREGIAKGLTVGDAFRREEAFPRVVSNLIAISEKAGHMDDILHTLADFYESEIDTSIKTLLSFLEPLLLLVIGGIIGTIALAVIIPIYQLITKV